MKTHLRSFLLIGIICISSFRANTHDTSVLSQEGMYDAMQNCQMKQNQVVKKYQVKSGIVTFETTLAGRSGKEILYFDDYGVRELVEKYSGDKLQEATLGDGTTMYKIKYDQKTAYKMGNASRGVAYKFDWNEIPEADRGTKATKLPNVKIAGKECESYRYETGKITTTYAGWNNICLLTEQKMKVGSSTIKAIRVDVDTKVAPEKLKVPAGFEIK